MVLIGTAPVCNFLVCIPPCLLRVWCRDALELNRNFSTKSFPINKVFGRNTLVKKKMFPRAWLEFLARERNKTKLFQDSPTSRGKGPHLLHMHVLTATSFGVLTRSTGKTQCFSLTEYILLSSIYAHARTFWHCPALAHSNFMLFGKGLFDKNMRPRDPDLWMWETITACSLRHHSSPLILPQNTLRLSDALYQRQLLLINSC